MTKKQQSVMEQTEIREEISGFCTVGYTAKYEFTVEDLCKAGEIIGTLSRNLASANAVLKECDRLMQDEKARNAKELDEAKKIADLYKEDRDVFEAENIELRKMANVEECTKMYYELQAINRFIEQLKQENTRLVIENRTFRAKLANFGVKV